MFIAASAAAITVLAFLFGESIVDISPLQETQAIDQMTNYLLFLVLAAASYFISAGIVWKERGFFREYVVPWLPIASIGSVICSNTFAAYIYIDNKLVSKLGPFASEPVSFKYTLWTIAVWSVLLFFIGGSMSALTSAIYTILYKRDRPTTLLDSPNVEKTNPKA